MTVCPCGCKRTIRIGCVYGAPQCYRRWKRQQAQPDLSQRICATCERKLTKVAEARGVRRCDFCLVKEPGRKGRERLHQGGKKATVNPASRISIRPGRAKNGTTEGGTWWIGLSSAELNAEAHRRHPDWSDARSSVPTRGARGAIAGTGQ